MTDPVGFVISLGGFVVLSLATTLFVIARPESKWARRILVLIVSSYACMSIYGISHVFVVALGAPYHPLAAADVPTGPAVVVVLGSGGYTARDWSGNEYSTPDGFAASRALEAARLFHLIDPAYVITSGGKIRPRQHAAATSVILRETLVRLGVPQERLLTESTSRTTHEEAVLDSEIVRTLRAEHVVLVTSDFHMRRAVGAFRAAGVEVIPAVSRDPFPPDSIDDWVVPGERGIRDAASAAHELLGIGYYRARGWYRSESRPTP